MFRLFRAFLDIVSGPVTLPGALSSPLNATSAIADDELPSYGEMLHWSTRLTHAAIVAGIAVGIALVLHFALFWLLRRIARRSGSITDSVAVTEFNQSVRWALVATGVAIASEANKLLHHIWGSIDVFVVPALIGWVVLALVRTLAEALDHRTEAYEDEIAARSRRTRIALLSRSIGAVIIVVTVAMIMLGIPGVAHIGATLIASAGLLTLAVGAAAQPALKSLFAGLQIAFTQPIRIGDAVVMDGENGNVEDIRFSYVVIRTGDERRLIVPTTRFLDTSFQNWTRVGGITGSVLLPIRPGAAIPPIREAFDRLLAAQPEWDKRTGTLQVSDAKVDMLEIKLVMSASGPAELATLRVAMREAMLEWLRTDMPKALCGAPEGATD